MVVHFWGKQVGQYDFACLIIFIMVTWAVPTNPLRKMAARKKTHGAPDARLYESPEVMALFEPIRMWLSKNCKKVKCLLKTAGHWMSGLSL